MTNIQYAIAQYADGTMTVSMANPTPIGGWSLRCQVLNAFGGMSGLISKYAASGYSAVSGVTITNSGQGVFQVQFNSVDTSGWDYGNYPIVVEKLNSGSRVPIAQGFFILGPDGSV